MAFTIAQIADIAQATYADLPEPTWDLIAADLREFVVMPRMFKYGEEISGEAIETRPQFSVPSNASHTGLFDEDTLVIEDNLQKARTRWSIAKVGWGWDLRQKAINDAGPKQIVDLLKKERLSALLAAATEMETEFFNLLGASDGLSPHGLQYWIVQNATEGFNGGLPTGHTTVGNISPTTYANWNNWTFTYSDWTKVDLIRPMRKAFREVDFKAPTPSPDSGIRTVSKRHCYLTTLDFVLRFEELAEDQNQNLGRDVASMDGNAVFRGIPMLNAHELENEFTTDPIYMVDLKYLRCYFQKGWNMKETPPFKSAKSHNMVESWFDWIYNFHCRDRRRLAVGYKV